jgi:hypothetical protein
LYSQFEKEEPYQQPYQPKNVKSTEKQPTSRPVPVQATEAESVEEDLTYVTEQLQLIQQTQDSILNSLRTDIDVVQAENSLLSQKNYHLQ